MSAYTKFCSGVFVALLVLGLLEVVVGVKVIAPSAAEVDPRLSDVNGDGVIDMRDVSFVSHSLGSKPGDSRWDSVADLNGDGNINLYDVAVVVKNLWKGWQSYYFNEMSGWNVTGGNWSVQNGTLEGTSQYEGLIYAEDVMWKDGNFTARVKIAADSPRAEAAVCFYVDSGNSYWAGLGCWGHRVSISRTVYGQAQELAFSGDIADVERDIWYSLTFKAIGSTIMLYIGDSLELSVNDSGFVSGSVGMRIWSSHVIVDYATVVGTPVARANLPNGTNTGGNGNGSYPPELLRVSGTKIVDGLGNVVYLKGMQVDWNEREKLQGSTSPATNYDQACWFALNDVQTMKAHGANLVDIAALEPFQAFPNRVPNEAYFIGRVDKIVSWCTQEKMYVIISIEHFDARWNYSISFTMMPWLWEGLGYAGPTTKEQYDAIIRDFHDLSVSKQNANRQAVVDVWKWIADRYKDNPYVMYSLFNEPLCGVDLLGQEAKFGADYSTYMTTIIDAMRSTGSKQVIFVDKPYTWSSFPTPLRYVQPIDRENIVWEDHAYVGNENLGDQNFEGWKTYVDAFAQRFMNDFGKPLYFGEWGIFPFELYHAMYPTTWQSILMNMADYLKAKGMCGQAWHNYGVLEGEYYDFESNTNYFTASESETIMQIVFG